MAGIAHLRDRPVGRVSGGEARKVSLCRALCQEPEILLLDEPTANLDPRAVADLGRLVLDAYRRFNLTVVMVTHRLDHLPAATGRVIMVRSARIIHQGDRTALGDARLLGELFADAA
jgi:ABC-type cobalamin/Fe3+-siderophores transport system ATPase subunit